MRNFHFQKTSINSLLREIHELQFALTDAIIVFGINENTSFRKTYAETIQKAFDETRTVKLITGEAVRLWKNTNTSLMEIKR